MFKECIAKTYIHLYEMDEGAAVQSEKHIVIAPNGHFLLENQLTCQAFIYGDWHTFYPVKYLQEGEVHVGYIIDTATQYLK